MRKPDAASVATSKASLPAGSRADAPAELVCLALVLALFVLAFRIVSDLVTAAAVSRLFISDV